MADRSSTARRKVLIHNNIIEVAAVAHLLARRLESLRDDLGRVLGPLFEAFAQRLERRRQDEDVHRIGYQLPHLRRALPVDLEQHVVSVP